jgi:hypothetical protein
VRCHLWLLDAVESDITRHGGQWGKLPLTTVSLNGCFQLLCIMLLLLLLLLTSLLFNLAEGWLQRLCCMCCFLSYSYGLLHLQIRLQWMHRDHFILSNV